MTKKQDMLSELAFSGRHMDCYVWVLTQKYNSVLTDLRRQIKCLVLFYCKEEDTFNEALKENKAIKTLEEKNKMDDLFCKHKHSKLVIITEPPTSYKFLL